MPDFILYVIFAVILFLLLIVFIYSRSSMKLKLATANNQLQLLQNHIQRLESDRSKLSGEREEYLSRANRAEERVRSLDTAMKEKMEAQKNDLENIGDKFRSEFRNLAQSILEEKSEKFTNLNETKIKAILDPFKEQLGALKQKVEDTYDKESKERFSLGQVVEKLVATTQLVTQEANNLTTALKGNKKLQGNWGEMILESLLENSGLSKDREYFIQEYIKDNAGNIIKDDNGKGLQPDVTIIYPDNRKVIIDSKVSLLAWESFINCEKEEDRSKCLQEHIRNIRAHIDSLSKKNYPKYAQALDYVLMFVPIEPAFLEAVKTDTSLWKYAYDKRILLISPTNLFAVLKIVADLWKVEQQNKNAIDIAERAGALYDKFAGFIDNMETLGKKLEDAQGSYDNAFKQLSTGRGNLIGRIEELKKMGAKASKQLPDRILVELKEE
jgi:DNA recombination protein RmuC